jgi:hypothetical protein
MRLFAFGEEVMARNLTKVLELPAVRVIPRGIKKVFPISPVRAHGRAHLDTVGVSQTRSNGFVVTRL